MSSEQAKTSVQAGAGAQLTASIAVQSLARASRVRRQRLQDRAQLACPSACALALALLLQASAALADSSEYRMAVFALESDEVRDQFADRLGQQLRTSLDERTDYALQDTRVSLVQLSLAQNCDTADPKCLAAIAQSLGVDGFVFGTVTHEGGVPAVVLRRYDLWSQKVDRSSLASFTSTAPRREELERASNKLLDDLLGPTPATTQGLPELAAPVTPQLDTPGELEAPERDVTASRVAGFALLGGAVLSTGAAVFSFFEVNRAEKNRDFERYRFAVGARTTNVSDVCDEANAGRRYGLDAAAFREAKSACSRGTTFEILQFVFIGGAVVSGGLAAYFLSSGGGDAKERAKVGTGNWSLHPTLARKGFGLGARMKF